MVFFVDRKEETRQLLEGLKSDESFVILGMRKIGKTELLKEVQRRLSKEDICSIRIQSSGEPDFEAVLKKIVEGLRSYYRKQFFFGRAIKPFNDLIKQIESLKAYRKTQLKKKNRHIRLSGRVIGSSLWPWSMQGEYLTEYDIEEVEKNLIEIRDNLEGILGLLSKKKKSATLLLDEFGIYGWKSSRNPKNEGHDFSNIRPTIDFFRPLIETWNGTLNMAVAASVNVLAFSTHGLPATPLELAPFTHINDNRKEDPSLQLIDGRSKRLFSEPMEREMMLWVRQESHRMPYYIDRFLNVINSERNRRGAMPNLSDQPQIRVSLIQKLIDDDLNQLKNYYSEEGLSLLEKVAEGVYVDDEKLEGTYLHLSHLISRQENKWEFNDPVLRDAFTMKKRMRGGK